MSRERITVTAETLRYFYDEWRGTLFLDGEEVFNRMVYHDGIPLHDGMELDFDEHYAEITADEMEVTLSYSHVEWEGDEWDEDFTIEDIEMTA